MMKNHFITEIFISNFTTQWTFSIFPIHLYHHQLSQKSSTCMVSYNLPWSSEIMRISFWKASSPKLVISERKVKVSHETKKRLRKTRSEEARASLKMEAAVLSKVHYLRGRFLCKGVGWVTSPCLESSS